MRGRGPNKFQLASKLAHPLQVVPSEGNQAPNGDKSMTVEKPFHSLIKSLELEIALFGQLRDLTEEKPY